MDIPKGKKLLIFNDEGKPKIEIKRHKDLTMHNILILNSIGNMKYNNNWIVEKDLSTWIGNFEKRGLKQIKLVEDVGANKEDNK